jgi:hypothetical protein
MRPEVNALMLDRTPKPFDEHVVHPSPFAVHAYLRPARTPQARPPAFEFSFGSLAPGAGDCPPQFVAPF